MTETIDSNVKELNQDDYIRENLIEFNFLWNEMLDGFLQRYSERERYEIDNWKEALLNAIEEFSEMISETYGKNFRIKMSYENQTKKTVTMILHALEFDGKEISNPTIDKLREYHDTQIELKPDEDDNLEYDFLDTVNSLEPQITALLFAPIPIKTLVKALKGLYEEELDIPKRSVEKFLPHDEYLIEQIENGEIRSAIN